MSSLFTRLAANINHNKNIDHTLINNNNTTTDTTANNKDNNNLHAMKYDQLFEESYTIDDNNSNTALANDVVTEYIHSVMPDERNNYHITHATLLYSDVLRSVITKNTCIALDLIDIRNINVFQYFFPGYW